MHSELQAAVLGILQGLTEFLPVSSSAHLTLTPWLLGWNDPGLAFDVALHMGSLLALLIYYRNDWLSIINGAIGGDRRGRRLLGLLVAASVPGAILGFLFEKQAETVFRSPLLIAGALAVLGLALWIVDVAAPQVRDIDEIRLGDALLIGLAQAFALVPGVSRSGATITVGRALGINRQDAANFSFLMSAPIIGGAGLLKAHELLHSGITGALTVGFVMSTVFSLAAIAILIAYVRTRTYKAFAWYRFILAAFVVAIYVMRAGHM
ncbi:MAG TPA: undecaprenyl-diphosphate phosphatase [Candidatus Binataceae bacterium]|nr:undecaprenyl-diphosphate phosphatase [Candidatus Binataceae bacterium]